MKVEYSNRAVTNLRKISADSRRGFGDRVAEALEGRTPRERLISLLHRAPGPYPVSWQAARKRGTCQRF